MLAAVAAGDWLCMSKPPMMVWVVVPEMAELSEVEKRVWVARSTVVVEVVVTPAGEMEKLRLRVSAAVQ